MAHTLHGECGGRIMRPENLHLTLVFLGDVARDSIPLLESMVRQLQASSFTLEFGATGYWRHNRIVWAAPRATPGPLRALVATLEAALDQAGCRDDRRPYAPHITLIRDARGPAMLPPLAFDWPVADFVLVESRGERGPGYRVLATWALAG